MSGPSRSELDARLQRTAHLGDETRGWTGARAAAQVLPMVDPQNGPRRGVRLSGVQSERVEWLWDRRIPLRKITLFSGDPGLGKSLILTDLGARVTRGRRMPDGTPGFEGNIVVASAEDGLADTIRPRFEAAGADLDRVFSLATLPTDDGHERMIVIPDDLPAVLAFLLEVRAVVLILDPLMAFLSSRINAHRDQDVRRALAPLAMAANKYGFAVLVVRHLNKSTSTSNPLYRGGGSIGIGGAARAEMVIGADPDNPLRRIVAPTKSNLGPPMSAITYTIEAVDDVPRIVWGGTSERSAEELLAPAPEDASQREMAAEFLLQVLGAGAVMDSAKVIRQAEAMGLKRTTVWRAQKKLGVQARKAGFTGGWTWELPKNVT